MRGLLGLYVEHPTLRVCAHRRAAVSVSEHVNNADDIKVPVQNGRAEVRDDGRGGP